MTHTLSGIRALIRDHERVGYRRGTRPFVELQKLFDAAVLSFNKTGLPSSAHLVRLIWRGRALWVDTSTLTDVGEQSHMAVHYRCPGTRVYDKREKAGIWDWLDFKNGEKKTGDGLVLNNIRTDGEA